MDRIIIIVCAILFVIVGGILIWWLKIGKQTFYSEIAVRNACKNQITRKKIRSDDLWET